MSASASACTPIRSGRRSRPAPSLRRPTPHSLPGCRPGRSRGLPVSIKDLFAAAGYPCFAGSSRRLPTEPWEQDGPLVATLRRQLGVIMGKTHMVEFAFGGTGQNSHHGAPYNPWDATAHRSVGGSSSGAGVSLLEGSAVLALPRSIPPESTRPR
jgi:Asp-tRNA(Asn)/Glu-tRNA(Gln) amidotransferase A subunit family amidase